MGDSAVCKFYSDFEALPSFYSPLFAQGETSSFDLSRAWFEHLAATGLEPTERLLLCGVEDPCRQHARAVLPLRRHHRGHALMSLSTYYSSLFKPLLAKPTDEAALVALFAGLRNSPERWSRLQLNPMPADAAIFATTKNAMQQAGWVAYRYFCFGNWYLPVGGRTFDAYWQELSSQLRNTVQRKRKRFLSQNGTLGIIQGGEELERALEAYQQVYAASWKRPEPYPQFIPGLIRQLAATGALRLGLAYVDERPVAAQLWIVSHGRAAIYKLAYDEQHAALSAGSILTAHLLKHVIDEDEVHEIDYLIGDEDYKKQWMTHRRERWGLFAYNPATFAGALGVAREWLKRPLKMVRRKVV